jgi:hypothetical protein
MAADSSSPVSQYVAQKLVSDKAVAARANAANIVNQIMRDNSGQAVSRQEEVRNLSATLLGPGADDRQLRIGIQRLLMIRDSIIKAKQASVSPLAKQKYQMRPGAVLPPSMHSNPLLDDDEEE